MSVDTDIAEQVKAQALIRMASAFEKIAESLAKLVKLAEESKGDGG